MYEPDRGAVLGGDALQIEHGPNTAGARHVLHHDVRIAGNVRGEIRREGERVGGVAAARPGAEDPVDLLALVEIGDRVRARCAWTEDWTKRKQTGHCEIAPAHHRRSSFG